MVITTLREPIYPRYGAVYYYPVELRIGQFTRVKGNQSVFKFGLSVVTTRI